MKTKDIQKQITQKEKEIKILKDKLQKEQDKTEWIKIEELGIEVQTKIHHKGKSYDDLVKEFGKEFLEKNLLTYQQIQALRNLEHEGKYKLGLIDTLEFVKQQDNISKENGYVARFFADSGYAYLFCGWYSFIMNSDLGVRFVRPLKNKSGKKDK